MATVSLENSRQLLRPRISESLSAPPATGATGAASACGVLPAADSVGGADGTGTTVAPVARPVMCTICQSRMAAMHTARQAKTAVPLMPK